MEKIEIMVSEQYGYFLGRENVERTVKLIKL